MMKRLQFGHNARKDRDTTERNLSVDDFDPIILLTPIWNGKPTPAMNEFLERINLMGKTVVLGLIGQMRQIQRR